MSRRRPDREIALLLAVFTAAALVVFAPAFDGPFVSDDLHYVSTNPYVHELSLENTAAILDPTSPATLFVVNYTPVHLLLHAFGWQLFGEHVTGHHVVNVLLHALGSALLALVFAQAGIPRAAAAAGGLLFLLHPANVEAVAWISQLKTPSSFALSMGALLAHRGRRPALGAVLFALALLAKPTAAFALPVAGLLDWTRDGRVRWGWLAGWAALLAGYSVAEFWTHQRSGAAEAIHEDALVRLRSSLAIGARYLWMSATSSGTSTFHEPAPVTSWLDPWWLAGAAACAGLGARAVVALRRRSPELAFWAWAAASFFPVSQLFPFLYPMADRYLYFILPGLLGGALFAALDAWPRVLRWLGARAGPVAIVAVLALAALFAARSFARAALWQEPMAILADSARHYPNGRTANLLRARRAAQVGDADTAVASLRAAWALGFNRYEQIQSDPALAPVRSDPRLQGLIREMAGWWVARFSAIADPTQIELRTLALAQLAHGERGAALATLERAQARGGPLDDQLRSDIAQVRALPR